MFSSPEMNVYEEMELRVRAEKGNDTSPWTDVDSFIPFQQGKEKLPAELHCIFC